MDDKQPMQLLRQGRDMSDEQDDRPKWMHTCLCGYSLRAAAGFISQAEISRMMKSHIESVHIDNVEK
jgi:hypothetical protein